MSQNPEPPAPGQEEIEAALDTFINAKTWQDGIEVIKAQKELLLSEVAFKSLRERTARSKAGQGNPAHSTEKLERHLRFLEDTKKWGLARAWREHLMREKPLVRTLMGMIDERFVGVLDDAMKGLIQRPENDELTPNLLGESESSDERIVIANEFEGYLYPGSPFLPGIDFGLLNPIIRDMTLAEGYSLGEAIAKGLGLVGYYTGDSKRFQRIGPENALEYTRGFTRLLRLLSWAIMIQPLEEREREEAVCVLLAEMDLPANHLFRPQEVIEAVPLLSADPQGVMLLDDFGRKELSSAASFYYKVGLEAARQTFRAYIDILPILISHLSPEKHQPRSLLFQLRSATENQRALGEADPPGESTVLRSSANRNEAKKGARTPKIYTESIFVEDLHQIRDLNARAASDREAGEQLLRIWEQIAGQACFEQYPALWTVLHLALGNTAWQQFLVTREKEMLFTARQALSKPMGLDATKADLGTRYACAMRLGAFYCEHGTDLEMPLAELAEAVHDTYLDALLSNERLYQRSTYQFSKLQFQSHNTLIAARMIEACVYLGQQNEEHALKWNREAFMVAEHSKSRLLREEMALADRHQPAGVPFELWLEEKHCLDQLRAIYANVTARQYQRSFDQTWMSEFEKERGEQRRKLEEIWAQMESFGDEARTYVLTRRDESLQWTTVKWDLFQWVVERLGQDFALISMSRLPEAILFMVLRAGWAAPQVCVVPLSTSDLNRYLTYCADYINSWDRDYPSASKVWQELGEILFPALEPLLDGVKYLYFLPYGDFHTFPLHALTLHGQPIIQRWGVAYAPSVSALESCLSRPRRDGSVLVMGYGPKERESTQIILDEALQIANILHASPALLEHAHAHALKEQGPSARLIHIACHGDADEDNPLNSGVIVADGRFTARDWLQLRLQADLVTLSACLTGQSAVRPGDDFVGLTRAVLFAGASSLLTCLWSVDTRSTRDWMLDFYQRRESNISRQKASATMHAFREAMLELRKAYPEPYYWAPFMLVGGYE